MSVAEFESLVKSELEANANLIKSKGFKPE